jgi:hypothetical protein
LRESERLGSFPPWTEQYQADQFRQGELTALACRSEEYMKMPPQVLKLLGFYKGGSGSGALGGKHPVEVWDGLKGYGGGQWSV